MSTDSRPIGVFDSGVGGLTVLHALQQRLPNESFVYLGDTARLPYGTKSQATICRYADHIVRHLRTLDIKLLVVACNSATAAALDYLRDHFPDLPIVGVIEPSVRAAAAVSQARQIALFATESTIRLNTYAAQAESAFPGLICHSQSAGLLVSLAEEGMANHPIAEMAVAHYLSLLTAPYDVMILGCTHFPVFYRLFKAALPPEVAVIHAGEATAIEVAEVLAAHGLAAPTNSSQPALTRYYVTDLPERFARVSRYFLPETIYPEHIDHSAG